MVVTWRACGGLVGGGDLKDSWGGGWYGEIVGPGGDVGCPERY